MTPSSHPTPLNGSVAGHLHAVPADPARLADEILDAQLTERAGGGNPAPEPAPADLPTVPADAYNPAATAFDVLLAGVYRKAAGAGEFIPWVDFVTNPFMYHLSGGRRGWTTMFVHLRNSSEIEAAQTLAELHARCAKEKRSAELRAALERQQADERARLEQSIADAEDDAKLGGAGEEENAEAKSVEKGPEGAEGSASPSGEGEKGAA